jgi:hypothetical protein
MLRFLGVVIFAPRLFRSFVTRALRAAAIRALAAPDSFRLTGPFAPFVPILLARTSAHRALCAAAIFARPAAEIFRVPLCLP